MILVKAEKMHLAWETGAKEAVMKEALQFEETMVYVISTIVEQTTKKVFE